jgi:hypothetical protein
MCSVLAAIMGCLHYPWVSSCHVLPNAQAVPGKAKRQISARRQAFKKQKHNAHKKAKSQLAGTEKAIAKDVLSAVDAANAAKRSNSKVQKKANKILGPAGGVQKRAAASAAGAAASKSQAMRSGCAGPRHHQGAAGNSQAGTACSGQACEAGPPAAAAGKLSAAQC